MDDTSKNSKDESADVKSSGETKEEVKDSPVDEAKEDVKEENKAPDSTAEEKAEEETKEEAASGDKKEEKQATEKKETETQEEKSEEINEDIKKAKRLLAEDDPNDPAKWYIIHTYSGHENKVARSIEQRVQSLGYEKKIFEIIVPTRNTIKVTQGKKDNVKEKIFPGYVLIKMVLDNEAWLLVRTTQGVTSFIGSGNKPTPISSLEVKAIMKFMEEEQPMYQTTYTIGEAVKIVDGPFSDFLGTIDHIDEQRGKLKVLVSIFGRETPVELDFLQVTKL